MCKQLNEGNAYTSIFALCRKSSEELSKLAAGSGDIIKIVENIDVMRDDVAAVAQRAFQTQDGHSNPVVPIHLLVHNAGAYGPPSAPGAETDYSRQSLEKIDAKSMRYAFELNTVGPLVLTQALLPNLEAVVVDDSSKHADPVKVIIISSAMGSIEENGSGGHYGYRTAKAGVNMVGKSLSVDLKDKNIAVSMSKSGKEASKAQRKDSPYS